jgi:hypothetical protein
VSGLTAVRNRGGYGAYVYTYAEPTEVGPRAPFQTELWVKHGRTKGQWMPVASVTDGKRHPWRKVRPGHSHADKLAHSIGRVAAGYSRERSQVCDDYCAWARLKGLTHVTVFARDPVSGNAARARFLELNAVEVSEFIGPASVAEARNE